MSKMQRKQTVEMILCRMWRKILRSKTQDESRGVKTGVWSGIRSRAGAGDERVALKGLKGKLQAIPLVN